MASAIQIPERLRSGDTVALIAPASAPEDARAIDRSVALLEAKGFRVKLGRNARKRLGYLAGTDRERAGDLMTAFADRHVKGIFCLRGGYGTARLLPLLDYRVIGANPKVFVGFSDITSLHCAFVEKANLLTFHGPMVASYLIKKDFPRYSSEWLFKMITEPIAPASIRRGYSGRTVKILRRGKAAGRLIGGNLSVLCALIGTPYEPEFRGRILYLEELEEKPYRVDRMLTHLAHAGVFQKVAGVAVGVCIDCEDPKASRARIFRQSLEHVLHDRLGSLNVPVVIGLPFGHGPHNATLPVGGRAVLDAEKGDLILTESAVK
jgi:muramoyltetrapeptide carboxypeptidase